MSEPNYKIQSVLFDKNNMTLQASIDWIIKEEYKIKKIDETDTQYRFRQLEPNYLKRKGYTEYRTKQLNDAISLIIVYKK
jgi:hypothetical protein